MTFRISALIALGLAAVLGATVSSAGQGERKILYWVAPMDPNFRSDKPGKSPMGMDLIPVYEDEGADEGPAVTIAPEVVQNLGIRTAPVRRMDLPRRIETVGYVDYDEALVSHLHLRVSGWIERLAVRSEGERVRRGQRLFDLYSPELVNAQEEFLQALAMGKKGLVSASRDRLAALGMTPAQIAELEKRRRVRQTLPVYARQDGVVSNLPVREGMYVTPSMQVLELADLSSVWLIAEVFERQVDWVREGDPAEVRLSFLPGRTWRGAVEYVYPDLDPRARTLRARLRFANPHEDLKPNMYADVLILADPVPNALAIPREALIRTGRASRVIVALGEGRFEAREVRPGIESGDWVEIREGLSEGETVVVSGQFLIDSEASLKASFRRLTPMAPERATDEPEGPISGTGRVLEVAPQARRIELAHEPIAALNWPAMRMAFAVDPGVDLRAFAPGESVRFTLRKGAEGYEIVTLESAAAPPPIEGRGLVRSVEPGARRVALEHEPIPTLGWPAMQMAFAVDEGVDLAALRPGDRVRFRLEKRGEAYVITAIDPEAAP